MTVELRTLGSVVKQTYEDNPNTNAYTDAEKSKLAGIEGNATRNSSDSDLLDRSKHIGFQAIGTISGLSDAMDAKVDKVTGKELSDNNFTNDEKTKLSGLEGPHFKGTYPSLAALQGSGIEAVAGDYADVDGGAGQETFRCIWDVTNEEWVQQLGTSTQLTGAQIKSEYEAQPDTNAYTDAEKSKLAGMETQSTKNDTDENLKNRANHTGTQAISTITGLQTALNGKQNAMRGNISSPIVALRAAPTGVVSSANGFYAAINTLVAQYDFYSILQNGENIVIPSWATYARIKWCYGMPNATKDSRVFARIKRDGVAVVSATAQVRNTEPAIFHSDTGIIQVSSGQVFTSDVWHSYGAVTAINNALTFVSVELFESI